MPHNFIPTSFDYGSDIVVIGSNSEMADYDNPRGHIHGLRPYIRAVDARGNTMIKYSSISHHVKVGDEEAEREARLLVQHLNERLLHRRMPDFTKGWDVGRPVYGSEAYQEYGAAEDLALERMEGEEF